jgi:serine/threonine protein kinase
MTACNADFDLGFSMGRGIGGEVFQIADTQVVKVQNIYPLGLCEAIFLSSLRHPNIVSTYGSCIRNGFLYTVMERGDETYLEWIRRVEPNDNQIRLVRSQIQCALDFLHDHGIIHRDLHTGNIMVFQGTPKLIDFGGARFAIIDYELSGDYPPWGQISAPYCQSGEVLHRPLLYEIQDAPSYIQDQVPESQYILVQELVAKLDLPYYDTDFIFIAASEVLALVHNTFEPIISDYTPSDVQLLMLRIVDTLNFQVL